MTQEHWSNRSIRQAFNGNLPAKDHPSCPMDARDISITDKHPSMSRNAVDQVKAKTDYEMRLKNRPAPAPKPKPDGIGFKKEDIHKVDKEARAHTQKKLDLHHAHREAEKHKTQGKSR